MLFVAVPGQPDTNRGFFNLLQKINLGGIGAEISKLGLKFEDLGAGILRFGLEI